MYKKISRLSSFTKNGLIAASDNSVLSIVTHLLHIWGTDVLMHQMVFERVIAGKQERRFDLVRLYMQ